MAVAWVPTAHTYRESAVRVVCERRAMRTHRARCSSTTRCLALRCTPIGRAGAAEAHAHAGPSFLKSIRYRACLPPHAKQNTTKHALARAHAAAHAPNTTEGRACYGSTVNAAPQTRRFAKCCAVIRVWWYGGSWLWFGRDP